MKKIKKAGIIIGKIGGKILKWMLILGVVSAIIIPVLSFFENKATESNYVFYEVSSIDIESNTVTLDGYGVVHLYGIQLNDGATFEGTYRIEEESQSNVDQSVWLLDEDGKVLQGILLANGHARMKGCSKSAKYYTLCWKSASRNEYAG